MTWPATPDDADSRPAVSEPAPEVEDEPVASDVAEDSPADASPAETAVAAPPGSAGVRHAALWVVGGVAGAALLGAGLLLGAQLATQPEPAPMLLEREPGQVAVAPLAPQTPANTGSSGPQQDIVGVSDPQVTAWHNQAEGLLIGVYQTLNQPGPFTARDVEGMCTRLALVLDPLAAVPEAPKSDVETAFRRLVTSLEKTVAACSSPRPAGETDEQFVVRTTGDMRSTLQRFSEFTIAIDPYFDFSSRRS